MKIIILFALGIFVVFSGCSSEQNKAKNVIVKKSDILSQNITVKGMTCVGCEVTLEKSIFKLEGVVSVKASHMTDSARIDFDKTKTNTKKIIQAIQDAGYKPE